MKAITWLHALMFLGSLLIAFPAVTQHKPATIVFTNAQIADGTGAALRNGSLRVAGDRITKVGDFRPDAGERVIDARGLVLAPGFIDIHNHSEEGLESEPLATTQIAQGITSMVLGADGESPWPVDGVAAGEANQSTSVSVLKLSAFHHCPFACESLAHQTIRALTQNVRFESRRGGEGEERGRSLEYVSESFHWPRNVPTHTS